MTARSGCGLVVNAQQVAAYVFWYDHGPNLSKSCDIVNFGSGCGINVNAQEEVVYIFNL